MDAALKCIPSIEEKGWDFNTRHCTIIEDNKKVVLRESWFDADEKVSGVVIIETLNDAKKRKRRNLVHLPSKGLCKNSDSVLGGRGYDNLQVLPILGSIFILPLDMTSSQELAFRLL